MNGNDQNKNILLHQIQTEGGISSFKEVVPSTCEKFPEKVLSLDSSGNLSWNYMPAYPEMPEIPEFPEIPPYPEIPEFNVIEDGKIKSTNIYYKDGRVGISRPPMYAYKFDIAVPENTLMTAFHVGDGKYGFSMGNGTSQGFIPEIIGVGSDENDAGLYFLGKAGNSEESSVPLIILDGRNAGHGPLTNRPIFGITSGNYLEYKMVVDQEGKVGIGKFPSVYKLEVSGSVKADDFVLDGLSVKALIDVIKEHQREIDILKETIELLKK